MKIVCGLYKNNINNTVCKVFGIIKYKNTNVVKLICENNNKTFTKDMTDFLYQNNGKYLYQYIKPNKMFLL